MSEQKNGPFDGIKTKLEDFRLLTINPLIREAKYKLMVPSERHEQNSALAETFAGEAMAFLREQTATKLSPVHPTGEQLQNCFYLFDAIEQGELRLASTKGGIQPITDRAFITKVYEAGDPPAGKDDLLGQIEHILAAQEARFVVNWDVNRQFPMSFHVWGSKGVKSVEPIHFRVLTEKATTPEQVEKAVGGLVHTDKEKTTVGVYNGGNKIIFNEEGHYPDKDIYITDQYYLIGSFEGEETGKTYWVYGNNENNHSRTTVKPRVAEKQPELQSVKVAV